MDQSNAIRGLSGRPGFRAILIFVMGLSLSFCGVSRAAQSVTLAWNASGGTGVAGYMMYYGTDGTNFNNQLDAGTNTTLTVSALQDGSTNYFEVAAYDVNTNFGTLSTPVTYVAPVSTQGSTGNGTSPTNAPGVVTNVPGSTTSVLGGVTNGLMAWYPLAGDANDYSGNGNNGTIGGSAGFTAGVSGTANTALSLNGSSQYVSLGHPSLYNFGNNDFTFSVWFETTSTGTPQQLFSCDDISGRQFIFDINDLSAGTVTAYLQNGSAGVVGYRTGNVLAPNTWYHAVLVRQGNAPGAFTLYLNGVAMPSFAAFQNDFPFTMGTTTSEVDIGRRTYAGYQQYFSGAMSGVAVYNRALAAGEVTTLYNNPPVTTTNTTTNGSSGSSGSTASTGSNGSGGANGSSSIAISPVPDQSATVGATLLVATSVTLSNAPTGEITYSLGAGAPAGAVVSTTGTFSWSPVCEQGSTTNFVTVWAVDNGTPAVSNSVSFNVTVSACVEISIGSSVVQTGNEASVPVTLYSTVSLSNVSFSVGTLAGTFSNWVALPGNAGQVTASAQAPDSSQPQFNFSAPSGGILPGSTTLGTIALQVLPTGVSAFAPLTVNNIVPTAADNSAIPTILNQSGRLVLVDAQPLLEMKLTTNLTPTLTMYGSPGASFQVVTTSSMTPPVVWTPLTNVTMVTVIQPINLPASTNQMGIFGVLQ
jgi:hypothetical protein